MPEDEVVHILYCFAVHCVPVVSNWAQWCCPSVYRFVAGLHLVHTGVKRKSWPDQKSHCNIRSAGQSAGGL